MAGASTVSPRVFRSCSSRRSFRICFLSPLSERFLPSLVRLRPAIGEYVSLATGNGIDTERQRSGGDELETELVSSKRSARLLDLFFAGSGGSSLGFQAA